MDFIEYYGEEIATTVVALPGFALIWWGSNWQLALAAVFLYIALWRHD